MSKASPQTNSPEPQFRFTGLFIPVEVIKIPNLSWIERIALSIIDALDGDDGCYATNAYLADHLKVSETRVSHIITKLKKLGLIEEVSFTGRRRILKSLKHQWFKFSKKDSWSKTTTLPSQKRLPYIKDDREDIFNKDDNSSSPVPRAETPPVLKSEPPISPAPSDYRPSKTAQSIVFFDPETYLLPNGHSLSIRCKRAFAKYTDEQIPRLLANLEYFEKSVAKNPGIQNQEAYLQKCIKENYAANEVHVYQNILYARLMKELHDLKGLEILKSVVHLKGQYGKLENSVSLKLPPESFSDIIDNYVKHQR